MGFLAPFFLFGLAAIALPVAIHLIRREKPPRVDFPSLRFLKGTRRKRVLFQQIQQWLLLALRAGVIALLVFAFARPLVYQGAMGQLMDGEPRSVVLLLDRSLAMQYGDRDSRLRDQAREVLRELQSADEVGIVPFSAEPLSVRALSRDADAARAVIDELDDPGYQPPRFDAALQAADALLADAVHERREIVLLSAFQATGMQGTDGGWQLAPGISLRTVNLGGEAFRNLTVTDARAPEQLVEGAEDGEVQVRVRSAGAVHADAAEVVLELDGREVARRAVTLEDRSEAVVSLPVPPGSAGQRTGTVRVEGDGFSADNAHHFAMIVQPPIRVLAINGSPSPDWYSDGAHWFRLALTGEGVEAPYELETTTPAEFAPDQLAGRDVLALLDSGVPEAAAAAVQRFVSEGGSLLIAPGGATSIESLARLRELLPMSLTGREMLSRPDYLLLADRERRHPILQPLDIDWSARFTGYWRGAVEDGDSRVLMRFDNGDPALVEGEAGQGRVLLLTTPLDASWSNLPLQSLYLPFVHEMLQYLAQPPRLPENHQVGDRVDLSGSVPPDSEAVLHGPDHEQRVTSLNPVFEPSMPGLYRLESAERVMPFAINIAPAATDMEPVPPDTLVDRVVNPETDAPRSEAVRAAQLMSDVEGPQRLWWWILLTVAVLLLLETRIANRTFR